MTQPQTAPASRDAERTRTQILDTATELFSKHGYEATALAQVSEAAGVARATPSYFFGSKAGLWQAVLDRQNRAVKEVAPRALKRIGPHASRQDTIAALVDAVFEFFEEEPAFIRLIGWSQLQGNALVNDLPSQWDAIAVALRAIQGVSADPTETGQDIKQTVMSVLALCSAHILLGNTLGTPLGIDVDAPNFIEARKTHLKRFLDAALKS